MKAMEKKILNEGKVFPGNILKVGSFLNHQLDTDFLMEVGREIAELYNGERIDKIVTIETSGVAVAFAAAAIMHVPVVYAKKHKSSNLSSDLYSAIVHSFTHNRDYTVYISKEYLHEGERILIVDDFLAVGNALNGLMDIVGQAKAEVVGMAVAIEKGFQGGGDSLRAKGIRVESMAIIDEMTDTDVIFRTQSK
ncbi:MAG: xanthine phosphoribosyltransferase [Clostridia bacterium]|nr:xanthine phosphoribosyltransferase [Clostridia bacterium]